MLAMRVLVLTAVITVVARASIVLPQARQLSEACQTSVRSVERTERQVNTYLLEQTAELRSLTAQLSASELESKRCAAWEHLDAEASKLLQNLERNSAGLVACMDQKWYDDKHAAWTRAVNGFRASLADCKVSDD
jgi:septal ring factor EnvC (AmiA/AmiB activator)